MNFWKTLHNELKNNHQVVLMYVVHSKGSSPGRQGFKMGVSGSGLLFGSIGGGFMEHKLVELCKKELLQKNIQPFYKRQIHKASVPQDKSGMICSGEQTIAFYPLQKRDAEVIHEIEKAILEHQYGVLELNENALQFSQAAVQERRFEFQIKSKEKWSVKEDLGFLPELHIVGGGHVGLALSKLAFQLGFRITVYDDRQGLNTVEQNKNARKVIVPTYEKIGDYISNGNRKYVVLMSFGYRTDKVVLKQLLNHHFKYLGMMGSAEKVKQLFKELHEEGFKKTLLNKIYAPIGIPIHSKTPEEIAVSIMAEIIQVKNK